MKQTSAIDADSVIRRKAQLERADTLTRRWEAVLDALTAYLARELTPEEERQLGRLVTKWGS